MNINWTWTKASAVIAVVLIYGWFSGYAVYGSATGRVNLTEVVAIHIALCYVTFVMALLALVKSSERKP